MTPESMEGREGRGEGSRADHRSAETPRSRRRLAWAYAVAALVWGSSALVAPAVAQDATARREARALFDRGIAAAAQDRFGEAALLFRQSYERYPRASTLYNEAIALDRAGRPRDALRAIDAFFDIADDDDPGLSDAATLRGDLQGRLLRLTLEVAPPDARVEVDGTEEPGTGPTRSLALNPGEHVVRVVAEGHRPSSLQVSGLAGETIAESVSLEPSGGAAPADAPAGTPAPGAGPDLIAPGVVLAIGGAFLVVGAALGVSVAVDHGDLSGRCVDGVCDPSLRPVAQDIADRALAADVLLGVGAATAVGGAIALAVVLATFEGDAEVALAGLRWRATGNAR